MKHQLVIVGIIVILLAVGLSGCNEKNTKSDTEDEINEIIKEIRPNSITGDQEISYTIKEIINHWYLDFIDMEKDLDYTISSIENYSSISIYDEYKKIDAKHNVLMWYEQVKNHYVSVIFYADTGYNDIWFTMETFGHTGNLTKVISKFSSTCLVLNSIYSNFSIGTCNIINDKLIEAKEILISLNAEIYSLTSTMLKGYTNVNSLIQQMDNIIEIQQEIYDKYNDINDEL